MDRWSGLLLILACEVVSSSVSIITSLKHVCGRCWEGSFAYDDNGQNGYAAYF